MRRFLAFLGTGGLLAVTVQSAALAAPVRYEAENAPATCNGTIDSNWAGFSGTGFCNATNAVGSFAQFSVTAGSAGTATLGIRYANGTTADRPADISVNGTVVAPASSFAPTGAWTTWVTKTVTAPVNAGSNTIRVAGTTANGPANLDFLDFEVSAPPTFTDYQAENCTISQGVVESNHAGFTGTGFVNGDNAAGSYVECSVSASAAGSATLTYRFANGSTANRPMSISVNGTVVNAGLAFNPTGAWTTWAEVSVTATLNAGANLVRATSTTANGGPNLDRLRASVTGPPDTTPPSTPMNARVTGTTCSTINVSWDASSDNVGVTAYRVYEGTTVRATPSGTSASLTGLAPSTSHTYTVTAVDAAGNESGPSAPVTGTTAASCGGGRPVDINGQLHVCGVNLCNQFNRPIQLRGMSTHGLQWFANCYNDASLNVLANDWRGDFLRISMYVQEMGYETNPTFFTNEVNRLVEEATERGLYALIDFHILTPGDPMFNLQRARTFFTAVSQRHAAKNNVIYEIANEPNGVSWATIKSYAEQIIPVIRGNDPDAPVIVGTRAWSSLGISEGSNANEVVNNPVNAQNIMYAFHFYAASHRDNYRAEVDRAAALIPLFVTEFGTVTFTGGGTFDAASSTAWLDLLDRRRISYANWTYSDADESSAAFRPGSCASGNFTTAALTESGNFMRNRIRTPDNFPTS